MIGYVPSTLVNVFGNYNLLLLHVVAQTLDELAAEAGHVVAKSKDNKTALYEFAYCYHDFAQRHPNRWQLIFEHNMNEALPEWQPQRIDSMTGMVNTFFRRLRLTAVRRMFLGCVACYGLVYTVLRYSALMISSLPISLSMARN